MRGLFVVLILLFVCVGIVSADTLIVYTTNATDTEFYYSVNNGTYSAERAYSAGTVLNGVNYHRVGVFSSSSFSNTFYRQADIFDTSSLPDTCTINSAILGENVAASIYTLNDDGIVPVSYTYDGAFNTDDYDYTKYGTIILSTYKNLSTFTTTGIYYNWTFNADGLAAISKTGNTGLSLRLRADINNDNAATPFQNGSNKGSRLTTRPAENIVNIPFLQIEYTPADTTPPKAITNLANGTYDCSDGHVDISWDNPTDTDYYRLNAYLNGTLTHYGNTTDSVTFTGLPENTAMTFNTATEDLAGNINNTHWQNLSFTTGSCAAPPVSNISCYFTNITGVSLGWNTSEWNITQGQWTWGTWITNVTQGNISYYSCYDTSVTPTPTPTPTITPTWTPEINPPSPDSLIGTIKAWIKKFLKDVFE